MRAVSALEPAFLSVVKGFHLQASIHAREKLVFMLFHILCQLLPNKMFCSPSILEPSLAWELKNDFLLLPFSPQASLMSHFILTRWE